MYVSKTPEVQPHTLHVGDWDKSLIADGEEVDFYNLSLDGSKWTVEVTDARYGDTVLVDDSLEWGLADSNVPGIGLRDDHFNFIAEILKSKDQTIFCDDHDCLGMNRCSDYDGLLEDFKFTISKRKTYYIAGD